MTFIELLQESILHNELNEATKSQKLFIFIKDAKHENLIKHSLYAGNKYNFESVENSIRESAKLYVKGCDKFLKSFVEPKIGFKGDPLGNIKFFSGENADKGLSIASDIDISDNDSASNICAVLNGAVGLTRKVFTQDIKIVNHDDESKSKEYKNVIVLMFDDISKRATASSFRELADKAMSNVKKSSKNIQAIFRVDGKFYACKTGIDLDYKIFNKNAIGNFNDKNKDDGEENLSIMLETALNYPVILEIANPERLDKIFIKAFNDARTGIKTDSNNHNGETSSDEVKQA